MKTQIWSQDLLSFRSLNQESVDTLQTARTSSLVDGRLAHIVLSDDKRIELQTEKTVMHRNCLEKPKHWYSNSDTKHIYTFLIK